MKKIFTFILLAISTLAMAQSFPSDPGRVVADPTYDEINLAWIKSAPGVDLNGAAFTIGQSVSTDAKYSAYVAYSSTSMVFYSNMHGIVVNKAAGYVRSLTINWNSETPNTSVLRVYALSSAIEANEVAVSECFSNPSGTLIGSITPSQNLFTISGNHQFLLLVGNGEPNINSIGFQWEHISEYAINTSVVSSANGVIEVATSTISGSKVPVTFKSNPGMLRTELTSYKIYKTADPTTIIKNVTIPESEYTIKDVNTSFNMPAYDVTIEASFQNVPTRIGNVATVYDVTGTHVDAKTINLVSGYAYNFTVATAHPSTGLSMKIASGDSKAKLSNASYTPATQTGSFTLTAYDQGEAKLTLTTVQSNSYAATTTTYTINVVPRVVTLVSQYDGKYYAAVNAITSGRLEAQEVLVQDDQVITTSDVNNLLWKVCTLNPDVRKDKEEYTVQTPDGKFLNIDLGGIGEFAYDTEHEWRKSNGRFTYAGNGIVYYATDGNFAAVSLLEHPEGAKEYVNYIQASAETLPRNLVLDQYNTVCMPYAFTCPNPNVKFYSLDCYSERGDKFHFNFTEEDFTTTPSVAGRPYIVKATDANHNKDLPIYKVGEDAAFGAHRGLIGMETSTYINELPNYKRDGLLNVLVFYKGTLVFTETGKVGANSAYIQFEDLIVCNDLVSAPARRVVLEVEKQDAPENSEIATGIKNALNVENINWNEPVYNIMGQRVARGTKGVLIQNGQKFIAE